MENYDKRLLDDSILAEMEQQLDTLHSKENLNSIDAYAAELRERL